MFKGIRGNVWSSSSIILPFNTLGAHAVLWNCLTVDSRVHCYLNTCSLLSLTSIWFHSSSECDICREIRWVSIVSPSRMATSVTPIFLILVAVGKTRPRRTPKLLIRVESRVRGCAPVHHTAVVTNYGGLIILYTYSKGQVHDPSRAVLALLKAEQMNRCL